MCTKESKEHFTFRGLILCSEGKYLFLIYDSQYSSLFHRRWVWISIFEAPPGFYNTDNTPSGDDLTHFLSILNNIKHWKKDSTMVPHPFGPISNWPPLQSSSTERGTSACQAFFSTFLLCNIFSLLLSTFYGKCSQSISRVSLEYEWIQEHPLICGQKKKKKTCLQMNQLAQIELKNSVQKSKSKPSTIHYLTK